MGGPLAKLYSGEFYLADEHRSDQAARAIVPLVIKLVRPRSVVDVGCGTGIWLRRFLENGVEEIHGIDGQWVDTKLLKIPRDRFEVADLSRPFQVRHTYDLAVSLEVAEHLPPSAAERFVETLTSLSKVILFSAAIPGQGGTGHVNEQWPDYWARRFGERGYVPVDCVRWIIWQRNDLPVWYVQNSLLYISRTALSQFPEIEVRFKADGSSPASVVHPRHYLSVLNRQQNPFRRLGRGFRRRIADFISRLRPKVPQ